MSDVISEISTCHL